MSLIVQKFGGSSVRDYTHLLRMARIVKSRVDEGDDVVVVLSAQGDTTDGLLQKAKEISERPSPRELDMLLSAGEQMSAALGAMTLRSIGVEAVSLCAWQIPIETDGTHGNAEIELVDTARIRKELAEGHVVVAAGFQGVDERGDVTTLGRGGSDTSAVALAAALKAAELVIYTDVDGIFSSDPRICKNAVRREVISYDDMLLLAQKGAQVLHDRSVALAQAGGVPITVRSCREGGAGSIVCETDEDASVVGVTQKKSGRSRLAAITAGGGALHAWETLLGSFWMDNGSDPVFAVPVDDDVARRFLDSMMDVNANGMTADSIPRLTEYVSADEVSSTADLVVLHGEAPDEALWMEIYGCTGGGETVSVSTADAIVGGDEFAAALLAALEKLSADETAQTVLRLYDGDGVRYGGADTQAVEFAQYLLGNTEGVYQLTSE